MEDNLRIQQDKNSIDQINKELQQQAVDEQDVSDQAWGKLNSITKRVKHQQLKTDTFQIGRAAGQGNDLTIQDIRLSGKHSVFMKKINADGEMKIIVEDLSSNGTFVNGELVGKGKHVELKNGDEIMLLRASESVKQKEEIGFIFILLKDPLEKQKQIEEQNRLKVLEEQDKKRKIEDMAKSKEQQDLKDKEGQELKQKMNFMGEQFECGICYELMHNAVTLMPCLHSFCGGCFSDWIKRQKDCPHCREKVNEVKKSAMVNSLIDNYLQLNPSQKRNPEILKELDKKNIFTMEIHKIDNNPIPKVVEQIRPQFGLAQNMFQSPFQPPRQPNPFQLQQQNPFIFQPYNQFPPLQPLPQPVIRIKPINKQIKIQPAKVKRQPKPKVNAYRLNLQNVLPYDPESSESSSSSGSQSSQSKDSSSSSQSSGDEEDKEDKDDEVKQRMALEDNLYKQIDPKLKDVNKLPQNKNNQCQNCVEAHDDGFKCNKNTEHLICTSCQRNFPLRAQFDQICSACDRAFCNLYMDCPKGSTNSLSRFKNYTKNLKDGPQLFQNTLQKIDPKLNTKATAKKINDILKQNQLKSYSINNKQNIEVQDNTIICLECAEKIKRQIIVKYVESTYGQEQEQQKPQKKEQQVKQIEKKDSDSDNEQVQEKEKEKQQENQNIVARVYNKVKKNLNFK